MKRIHWFLVGIAICLIVGAGYGGSQVSSAGHPSPVITTGLVSSDFIHEDTSTMVGWSGTWSDLMDDVNVVSTNSTSTNPKVIDMHFKQTMPTLAVGVFGDHKNIKITVYNGTTAIVLLDNSADATVANFSTREFNGTVITRLLVEFYTADAISLTGVGLVNTMSNVAQIRGLDSTGTSRTAMVTEDGYLTISDSSNGLSIAAGDVTGHSFIHKFGTAPDWDKGEGEVTIWDGSEDGALWENMVYDYSATADIDSISSSDETNDVGITLEIQGLDTNYALVIQTATLHAVDARTEVTLTTSLRRVFRVKNTSATNLTGHVAVYPSTALTTGIPTDKSKIRAVVHPDNNQTEMAIYTVPAGYTAYVRSWYASTSGGSKDSNYIIRFRARELGGVFQLKHKASISDGASSYIHHKYVEPEVFTEKTDIELTVEIPDGTATAASVSGGFDIVLIEN